MIYVDVTSLRSLEDDLDGLLGQYEEYLGMEGSVTKGHLSLIAKRKGVINLTYSFTVEGNGEHLFSCDLEGHDATKVMKAFLVSDEYRAFHLELYKLYLGE